MLRRPPNSSSEEWRREAHQATSGLETAWYSRQIAVIEKETPAPQAWIDAIARGEADLAAGRVVSGEALLRGLDDSIARMQTAKAAIDFDDGDRTISAAH